MNNVNDGRHVLVLPDREAAEVVADLLAERFDLPDDPTIRREALAGEDDAEDAQYLVLVEDEDAELDPSALDGIAGEYGGWLEEYEEDDD